MSFDPRALAARVRELGNRLSPAVLEASQALYAPFHEREPYAGVRVTRDLAYGGNERQRLDLFEPLELPAGRALPVLVFVHGGGFVGGDKKRPGTPYHDNVALWAVRHGMLGANITYRLAPGFAWPAGAEDAGAALAWLRKNVQDRGGDPERMFLMGTSAGAVHAASYAAHPAFHPAAGAGIAGAILVSGLYDLETAQRNALLRAYFGEDPARYAQRSTLAGLLASRVPLLFALAEHDPDDFEAQALRLVGAFHARQGRWPRLARLMGHNHFTATLHLNTPDEWFGRQVLDFTGA
ncbi:MAG: alpha/beta hydrolase [Burkholderiales bacterium]|nr:alpha/beta hydrolase [Burkholderiales bacterium]